MRNRAATSLSKAKVRQSWSKYNLFNLSRLRDPYTQSRSHFQQKWTAKGMARAYHGEQVSETKWERMFSRRIRSVVPMSPLKLAQDDGSAMAAGRGTGITSQLAEKRLAESQSSGRRNVNLKGEGKITPFTQMTFAPLERRLDVAVFRAMFASSARQARQFVIHGAVTVNGKKMRYPGYQLNPGDLFQVDPDRVMFATGAPKDKLERREARVARRKDNKESKESEDKEGAAAEESNKSEAKDEEAPAENEDPRETLKALLAQAKNIMNDSKDVLPAKRKQELRGFTRATRRVLSRSGSSTVLTDNLEAQFAELTLLLKAKRAEKKEDKDSKDKQDKKESKPEKAGESDVATAQEGSAEPTADASETKPGEALSEAFRQAAQNPEEEVDTSELTDEEFDVLKHALVQMRDNPIDHSKPYATPWRPRDYMSAFAMIPRYLEVNHNVCAAVYLRHPVARPGLSEVPTPFGEGVGTAAFTWYLRRR